MAASCMNSSLPTGQRRGLTEKQIEIPAELKHRIADVRDNSTSTDWVLASLSAESQGAVALVTVGSGSGGVNELREKLTQDNIFFGLVRTTEMIDKTVAVKFVAISFIGEEIGVMRKALISTLRGDINAAFDPFHCELLNVSTKEEVTVEAVATQLGAMFGGEVKKQAGPTGGQGESLRIGQRMVKVMDKEGPRKASILSERQAVSMPTELPAALADVRNDASPTNWCLCGFETAGLGLAMMGTGTGGVAEMALQLSTDNIFYALVRTTQVVDPKAPPQVRFVFVSFVGEGISAMRRAKIATLRGTIAAEFDPFHAELLNASTKEEVTEEAIAEQLGSLYGGAVRVPEPRTDGSSTMRIGQKTVTVNQKSETRQATALGERQAVSMPTELPAALADVRNDASPTNWCLCGFEGAALRLIGSGSGGVTELAAHLSQDNLFYGLVRTTETIDKTVAVKFIFLSFIGEHVPMMKKAKTSTLKGTITEAFEPFHAELLNASALDEVTVDALEGLLKKNDGQTGTAQASGQQAQRAGQADGSSKVTVSKAFGGADAAAMGKQEVEVVSEEVRQAVAAVRSDAEPCCWCLLGYSTDKAPKLVVVARGDGAAEEMSPYLAQDALLYALVRVNQTIDASLTVKFVLVSWVGEGVPPMRKAKLSAMRGQASTVLSPYHTELLNVASAAEVTHAAIMKQLEP